MRNRKVVATRQLTTKRCVSFVYLDLDVDIIQILQLRWIPIINIMEMKAIAGLAGLGIGFRKCSRRFEVLLQRFLTIIASKIEVDDNVILWNPNPMLLI